MKCHAYIKKFYEEKICSECARRDVGEMWATQDKAVLSTLAHASLVMLLGVSSGNVKKILPPGTVISGR